MKGKNMSEKQFIKQNDANGARQALKRAKEINAQLDTLN